MSEYLDQALAKKFHGYSDSELIRRIENSEEFGYDDEIRPGKGNVVVRCLHCKQRFKTYRYLRRRGLARFCSVFCKTQGTRKPRSMRQDAVQLSDGKWTLVSPEDLEWARTLALNYSSGYAGVYHDTLHRMIMVRMTGKQIPRGAEIDHVNGDKLDNRRSNLRISHHAQNAANTGLRRTNTSGFKGVFRNKLRWSARLVLHRKSVNIGTFDTPDEAAWMYDQWAIALVGEFARTNFEYKDVM